MQTTEQVLKSIIKKNKVGLGMKNIESRIDFLAGILKFSSEKDKGASFEFSFS